MTLPAAILTSAFPCRGSGANDMPALRLSIPLLIAWNFVAVEIGGTRFDLGEAFHRRPAL
jgi:hypothetical protein